jgi:hypothetical protein
MRRNRTLHLRLPQAPNPFPRGELPFPWPLLRTPQALPRTQHPPPAQSPLRQLFLSQRSRHPPPAQSPLRQLFLSQRSRHPPSPLRQLCLRLRRCMAQSLVRQLYLSHPAAAPSLVRQLCPRRCFRHSPSRRLQPWQCIGTPPLAARSPQRHPDPPSFRRGNRRWVPWKCTVRRRVRCPG